jgi:hypothetical protein
VQGIQRLSLVHRTAVLSAAPARVRGAAKRRRLRRIDDVYDDRTGRKPLWIDWHGVVRFHAKRRCIDHDLEAEWIGEGRACIAARRSNNSCRKIVGPTLIDIRYG